MCVIVDSCSLAKVFDTGNAEHANFAPVREWVMNGRGKVVFGGTKFKDELKRASRYMALLVELGRQRKTVSIPDADVDRHEGQVNAIYNHKGFNDSHLAAIVRASKCRLICTCDTAAVPHLKRTDIYAGVCGKPKFYLKLRNRDLLNRRELAGPCCT
ncbi:MAG: hypothetical protein IT482_06180 [Gammaproteobacteria bacterium]|nr:hypothetical protein [Gammaproteobacteria bacterium]